jgi:Domain of unknown function (DUF1918)
MTANSGMNANPGTNANPGDELVVDPVNAGEPKREGEILEVETRGGVVHYRVRWDDGHESTFFPGSTTHVVNLRPT